jgi:catechol 2,3-dioxygenase-like lactoylglutathione lyase family enzyme
MSTKDVSKDEETKSMSVADLDMKFEVVVIPVADVNRAKEFYSRLGWRLDADFDNNNDFRVIQFTPPGSACSIIFGKNITAAAPGSAPGLYLIVADIETAREDLLRRGVKVSEVFHGAGDVYAGPDEPYLFGRIRVTGPDPAHGSYRSFASFHDPDGNGWLLQDITSRLPGRISGTATTFASANDLASAFRRAGPHTANTRSAPGSATQTGQTGMPRTWWRRQAGRGCRSSDCERSLGRRVVGPIPAESGVGQADTV